MDQDYLWGIDLGGTKIEGVILENNSYKTVARKRIPTERELGYDHIISNIEYLVNELKNETKIIPKALGLGTPGAIDFKTNTLKNSNTVALIGKPIKEDLEEKLNIKISMANDANLFTLSETHLGSIQDLTFTPKTVFGVILGTGVGGGIVVNGKIISGTHNIAGEWGHNYLSKSGGECYCGRIGCVETVISGIALQKFYKKLSGNNLSLENIIVQNNEYSNKTINRLIHFFSKAISSVINILDPDVIVLGGGVSNIDAIYERSAVEIQKYIFNGEFNTKILKAKLGDSSGVLGAALLSREVF